MNTFAFEYILYFCVDYIQIGDVNQIYCVSSLHLTLTLSQGFLQAIISDGIQQDVTVFGIRVEGQNSRCGQSLKVCCDVQDFKEGSMDRFKDIILLPVCLCLFCSWKMDFNHVCSLPASPQQLTYSL